MWRATRYTTPCIYNLINALYKIIADNNLKINLDIPISELSEYKYNKFKKNLEGLENLNNYVVKCIY